MRADRKAKEYRETSAVGVARTFVFDIDVERARARVFLSVHCMRKGRGKPLVLFFSTCVIKRIRGKCGYGI